MERIDAIHEIESIIEDYGYTNLRQFEDVMREHGYILVDTDIKHLTQIYRKDNIECVVFHTCDYVWRGCRITPILHSVYFLGGKYGNCVFYCAVRDGRI